ncbi:MAG: class III signal peptide-containing protein [Candidatus Omnitrophica bacterium]|nr:class III signal peptide-containing protein [Candidatus Omnitrophota bacterium]
MFRRKKGQSTLEYIIIFTVVVAAVLWAANKAIRGKMMNIFSHTANETEAAVKHIDFGGGNSAE